MFVSIFQKQWWKTQIPKTITYKNETNQITAVWLVSELRQVIFSGMSNRRNTKYNVHIFPPIYHILDRFGSFMCLLQFIVYRKSMVEYIDVNSQLFFLHFIPKPLDYFHWKMHKIIFFSNYVNWMGEVAPEYERFIIFCFLNK